MKANDINFFERFTDSETFSRLVYHKSVGEMWEAAASYGDRHAIEDKETVLTYSELDVLIKKFRGYCAGKGIVKGDRVGILLPNSADFVKAFFALSGMGVTVAVLPVQLDPGTVFGVSMMFGLKGIVSGCGLEEKLAVAEAKKPGFVKLLANGEGPETGYNKDVQPDDDCVIMFTGGTTGRSKGALLSHRNIIAGTVFGCYSLKDVFYRRYILCLPLSHVFGLVRNLLCSVYTGSTLCICRNNKDLFADIGAYRPDVLVTVPALVEMALGLSRLFKKNMFGTIEYIICGAAWVPPYLITECGKLGVTIYPGYGLTESANLVSGNPTPAEKPESVGIPYPGQEFKLVDGELWIKGVNIMKGYVGAPEENAIAFTEDGWFKTGDLAKFDEDGYLYITGRTKEIIVLSNGENVSPAEVEAHYDELNYVQDCQLFEDADGDGPHFLHLEIVPRKTELAQFDAETANAKLMEAVNKVTESLPAYQRPQRITVRTSDFERTPAMKIKRYKKFG